jgi:hypothetical protein
MPRETFAQNPELLVRYELAHSLGMTVAELEQKLSPHEYMRWIAYFKREPRSDRRLDANIGWLVFWIRRVIGDKSADLMTSTLQYKHSKQTKAYAEASTEDQAKVASQFKFLADMFRAKDKRK